MIPPYINLYIPRVSTCCTWVRTNVNIKGRSLHLKVVAWSSAWNSHYAEIRPWFWKGSRGELGIPHLLSLIIYCDVVKANDLGWIAFTQQNDNTTGPECRNIDNLATTKYLFLIKRTRIISVACICKLGVIETKRQEPARHCLSGHRQRWPAVHKSSYVIAWAIVIAKAAIIWAHNVWWKDVSPRRTKNFFPFNEALSARSESPYRFEGRWI